MSPVFGRSGEELAGGVAMTGLEGFEAGWETPLLFDSPGELPHPIAKSAADAITNVAMTSTPHLIIFHPSFFSNACLVAIFMASVPTLSPTPTGTASARACSRPDTIRSGTILRRHVCVRGRPFRCAPVHLDSRISRAR